jgi:hypothetical protein
VAGSYSKSDTALWKRQLDAEIAKKHVTADAKNSDYLKMLIFFCTNGASPVSASAAGLQFYMINGGAEGFLDSSYTSLNASRVTESYGQNGRWQITYDDNDLLIAFDKSGKLINSSLLRRPLSITDPSVNWTEDSANKVYDAWDNCPVIIYRNTTFTVAYYGLMIKDKLGYYNGTAIGKDGRKHRINIDLHKEEGTLGCIFIMDPNNPLQRPPYDASDTVLSHFEPQFIKDVMKAIGGKTWTEIGTMHMLDVYRWDPTSWSPP